MAFTIDMEENRIVVKENDETICWLNEAIEGSTAAISLGGRLRADTAYVFLDEVNALSSVGLSLVLDMHEVRYLSNAYLQAMRVIQRSADARHQALVLRNLSAEAKEAMDAVGAGFLFDIQ